MRRFIAALFMIGIATPAIAQECKPSDFAVTKFQVQVLKSAGARHAVLVTGNIKNNCSSPSSVSLQFVAEDDEGDVVVTSLDTWFPRYMQNIEPGQTIPFSHAFGVDGAVEKMSFTAIVARVMRF